MSYILSVLIVILLCAAGCTAPNYISVPPALPTDEQYRGLSPSFPSQAIVRDQHLGELEVDMHHREEVVLRAEQNRLQACRAPEASLVDSIAYQRCQFRDQIYQQLTTEAAMARDRYLRAVSGSGGTSR